MAIEESPRADRKHPKRWSVKAYVLAGLAVLVIIASIFVFHSATSSHDPVPSAIRKAVAFDVYYPGQRKLPPGYSLDLKSFTANDQAVLYTISYGNSKISVSVQQKPSTSAIQSFYASHLPLHDNLTTDSGTAAVGVLNNETFASLPTKTNAWLLVTAPSDISQPQFDVVLRSFIN